MRPSFLPLSVFTAVLLGISGCCHRPTSKTGLVEPGTVVAWDLLTPDSAAAATFYAAVAGWDSEPGSGAGLLATMSGTPVAGFIEVEAKKLSGSQAVWLPSLWVPSTRLAASRVAQSGGEVLTGPGPVSGRGNAAVIADPLGGGFAVVEEWERPAPRNLRGPGTWVWAEVAAGDVARIASFLGTVTGVVSSADPADATYLPLGSDGKVGAVIETPFANIDSVWVPFLRVASADAAAAAAEANGGSLLLGPLDRPRGGRIAVIADPQGAILALIEESPES